jgi:hypothetical protein
MRIYIPLALLSLLTFSLSVNSQSISHSSTPKTQSTTSSQLLAATQTGLGGEKSPDSRRGSRRNFSRLQKMPTTQLCHRGSGRRELSESRATLTS